MKTQLDSLINLFEEAYGEGESAQLFSGDYGIQVVHPDTTEKSNTNLNPVTWSHYARLLATGWKIQYIFSTINNERWNYANFELNVWLNVGLEISPEQVLEILQPLKPLRAEQHPKSTKFWMLIFSDPMGGMDKWLLENCAGIKLITRGDPIENGYARQNPEIGYGIIITSMAALQLPE